MNEHIPTPDVSKKSTERISEEIKLRELIEQLESKAAHSHGTQADSLESEIITSEEKLRTIEKSYTDKPTASIFQSFPPPQETVSVPGSTSTIGTQTEVQQETPMSKDTITSVSYPFQDKDTSPKLNSTPEVIQQERAQHLAERAQVGLARQNMLKAEAAYLGAFRKQYKDQSMFGRLTKDDSPQQRQRDQVKALREAYDRTRAEFANIINQSAQKRFDTKHNTENLPGTKLRTQEVYKEKVLHRYNRMVVSSDIIKRSLHEKAHAKKEGLDESGRLSLNKALGYYARGNKAIEKKIEEFAIRYTHISPEKAKKIGKIGTRGLRIAVFASIFGAAGGLAVVGHKIIRSGIGAVLGTGAGAAAGKIYEKKWGQKSAEKYKLKSEQAISSVEDIAAQEKAYKEGSSEAIENKRQTIEMVTAAIVGFTSALESSHFFTDSGSEHTVSGLTNHGGVPHATAPSGSLENIKLPPEVAAAVHQTDVNAWHDLHPGEPYPGDAAASHIINEYEFEQSPPTVAPPVSGFSATPEVLGAHTVNGLTNHGGVLGSSAAAEHLSHAQVPNEIISVTEGKGEGADALFGHLKESLRVAYPDPSTAPPEVQHILDTRLHVLSTEYGFAEPGANGLPGESGLMYTSDTMAYDPSNGHLIFTDSHGVEHTLASTVGGKVVSGANFSEFNGHYTQDAPNISEAPVVHAVNGLTNHGGVLGSSAAAEHLSHAQGHAPSPIHAQAHAAGHSSVPAPEHATESPTAHTAPKPHTAETSPSVPETTTTPFDHEVASLLKPDVLGHYAHTSFSDVLYNSPNVSTQLHKQLIDIVAHSGVGPTNNETLEHFLDRTQHIIDSHGTPVYEVGAHNLHIPVNETQIYTDTHGDLVVYGGDQSAQHLVAYQYLSEHPKAQILFERGGDNAASGVNVLTLHNSPLSIANSQPYQSFEPLLDSSGHVIPHINPHTLTSVVQ